MGETILWFWHEKMKFREDDYQMLPLPIDRKCRYRDQLLSIFIEDEKNNWLYIQ